jgi:hypothetical protein
MAGEKAETQSEAVVAYVKMLLRIPEYTKENLENRYRIVCFGPEFDTDTYRI